MKSWMLVVCSLWVGFAAMAQTPASSSTTTPDNSRYTSDMNLLPNCQKRLDEFTGQPCDVIFIGDSITAFFPGAGKGIWDKYYGARHALDFGISGDTTQNVLWRLGNMKLQDLKPKVAVILIGTNNRDNTVQEIADGVKAVLSKTQEIFPGAKIILVSIMPNALANDKMMAADAIIKGYADDTSVNYLDMVAVMTPMTKTKSDGTTVNTWKGLSSDLLHPDYGGYLLWAQTMEPLMSKLLGDTPVK